MTRKKPLRQPLPIPGVMAVEPVVRESFNDSLSSRTHEGIKTYGSPLQTHNGRDAGRDAWEELVDLAQYLTQLRLEHADLKIEVSALRAENAALREGRS